jgi:uncharacterized glyoxalase superfamily protein PhnB
MISNRSIPDVTVIPVLHYPDVIEAARWLCTTFGFRERLRIGDHRVQLLIGHSGALVVANGSSTGNGHSVMIRVEDVDAHLERATSHGARVAQPATTYPYGERQYSTYDPWGHAWTFTQSMEDVDPAAWGGELRATANHTGRRTVPSGALPSE